MLTRGPSEIYLSLFLQMCMCPGGKSSTKFYTNLRNTRRICMKTLKLEYFQIFVKFCIFVARHFCDSYKFLNEIMLNYNELQCSTRF